ncbi:MAG: alanine racemase, partial [Gammaproteobacteria bacterium]|nr:alanine racemase [Gammaproteobacteria bacterium]
MTRATTALIDLDALTHNLQRARRAAPIQRVAVAIKANAYGHGLLRVARALQDADAFAVASIDEAMTLREGGIQHPILLLEGAFEAAEIPLCSQWKLALAIHHVLQVEMLERTPVERPVRAWLKIDTGMHRLGITPELTQTYWQRLRECPSVDPDIRLMSHLARADERDNAYTLQQLQIFEEAAGDLPGERSLANSAAVLGWPNTHFDWVRPGIMVYGAS